MRFSNYNHLQCTNLFIFQLYTWLLNKWHMPSSYHRRFWGWISRALHSQNGWGSSIINTILTFLFLWILPTLALALGLNCEVMWAYWQTVAPNLNWRADPLCGSFEESSVSSLRSSSLSEHWLWKRWRRRRGVNSGEDTSPLDDSDPRDLDRDWASEGLSSLTGTFGNFTTLCCVVSSHNVLKIWAQVLWTGNCDSKEEVLWLLGLPSGWLTAPKAETKDSGRYSLWWTLNGYHIVIMSFTSCHLKRNFIFQLKCTAVSLILYL